MNKIRALIILVLISGALGGCTAGFVKPYTGSPTMAQTYETAAKGQTVFYGNTTGAKATVHLPRLSSNKAGDAGKFASVLDSQFPKLPNPQNLMYIFGHYAANGEIPVPGHFITFSMYRENHYALPSEIQRPYNDGQFIQK